MSDGNYTARGDGGIRISTPLLPPPEKARRTLPHLIGFSNDRSDRRMREYLIGLRRGGGDDSIFYCQTPFALLLVFHLKNPNNPKC